MEKIKPEEKERIMKAVEKLLDSSKQNILLLIDADTLKNDAVFVSKGFCKQCIRENITKLVETAFVAEPRYAEDCKIHDTEGSSPSPYTWI